MNIRTEYKRETIILQVEKENISSGITIPKGSIALKKEIVVTLSLIFKEKVILLIKNTTVRPL